MSEHVARLTAIRDFWLPLSKDSSEDVQVILADIDAVLVDLERANAALAEAQKERGRALEDAGAARLAFDDWRVAHSTVQLEAENERLKHQLAEAQRDARRMDWLVSSAGYGIDERQCAILRLTALIPAPDHIHGLRAAIDAELEGKR